jgi:hypothetical protein
MIKIWDLVKEEYWQGEDCEDLVFDNETAARNMMYTEGYKLEYVETGIEFHPFTPIDKSGYEFQ